ncbi:MAG: hypothetical protein K5696_04605 [Lachnospiraceae bacterium]|nr:hypothetical protein [Lachnospiraceae bacterium]
MKIWHKAPERDESKRICAGGAASGTGKRRRVSTLSFLLTVLMLASCGRAQSPDIAETAATVDDTKNAPDDTAEKTEKTEEPLPEADINHEEATTASGLSREVAQAYLDAINALGEEDDYQEFGLFPMDDTDYPQLVMLNSDYYFTIYTIDSEGKAVCCMEDGRWPLGTYSRSIWFREKTGTLIEWQSAFGAGEWNTVYDIDGTSIKTVWSGGYEALLDAEGMIRTDADGMTVFDDPVVNGKTVSTEEYDQELKRMIQWDTEDMIDLDAPHEEYRSKKNMLAYLSAAAGDVNRETADPEWAEEYLARFTDVEKYDISSCHHAALIDVDDDEVPELILDQTSETDSENAGYELLACRNGLIRTRWIDGGPDGIWYVPRKNLLVSYNAQGESCYVAGLKDGDWLTNSDTGISGTAMMEEERRKAGEDAAKIDFLDKSEVFLSLLKVCGGDTDDRKLAYASLLAQHIVDPACMIVEGMDAMSYHDPIGNGRFMLRDLDGDGRQELLVTKTCEEISLLVPADTWNEASLCRFNQQSDDGVLEWFWGEGGTGSIEYHRLKGSSLEEMDRFEYDVDIDGYEPDRFYHVLRDGTKTPITEDDFYASKNLYGVHTVETGWTDLNTEGILKVLFNSDGV